jgi:hypothetical protein
MSGARIFVLSDRHLSAKDLIPSTAKSSKLNSAHITYRTQTLRLEEEDNSPREKGATCCKEHKP